MENNRKWIGWIIAAGVVIVAATALAVNTMGNDAPAPFPGTSPTASPMISASPSALPQATVTPGMQNSMTANASAIGYGGPVLVRLTLNDQGRIEAMDVGGARFSETEGVGSRVKEESFVQTFIGKTPPLSLGEDVDAVSGATLSSRAVVEAVNDAAAFLAQNQTAPTATDKP